MRLPVYSISFFCFALTTSPTIAQHLTTFENLSQNYDECSGNLYEFGWVCEEFESTNWNNTYDHNFWDTGYINAEIVDLDIDGRNDLILRINHSGYCGTAGCKYLFFFGDHEVVNPPRIFGVNARNHPTLDIVDGEPTLWFYPDGAIFNISSIKAQSETASRFHLGD